jgi:radical SAM superfamily enzyme YgiQ (UPF0313 family)
MTPTITGALEILKLTKEVSTSIITIIGGVHLSVYPEETVQHSFVDYGVIGEGEEVLPALLSGDKGVGVVYKINGRVIISTLSPPIKDLDKLPFPARHLLPNKRYQDILGKHPMTTMIAARGCPFSCNFCYRDEYSATFRVRGAMNIVDEMEECIERYRVKEIAFHNDCFASKTHLAAICEEIIRRGLKVAWEAPQRVDLVDLSLLKLMKRAGCIRLRYGIESGNQHILDLMNKRTTLAEIETAVQLTKQVGIETFGYFMTGYLGEGEREVRDTIDFAKRLNPQWLIFAVATPLPRTKLMEQVGDTGYWRKLTLGESLDRIPFINEDAIQYCKTAYREFYLRPQFVWSKLKGLRSFNQLIRYARGGLALIRFQV